METLKAILIAVSIPFPPYNVPPNNHYHLTAFTLIIKAVIGDNLLRRDIEGGKDD